VPEDEEFLVAGGAQAVDENGCLRCVFGAFDEDALDEQRREVGGVEQGLFGDAGLAMEAEADGHLAGGEGEEGCGGAGWSAAGEGDG
jgi:hypothetical protein